MGTFVATRPFEFPSEGVLADFHRGWQQYHSQTHRHSLKQIGALRSLAAGRDLCELDGPDVHRWLEDAIAEGLKPSSVGQRLNEIRPFYTWAFSAKLIDAERYLSIRGVKPPRNTGNSNPRPYSEAERGRFWLAFDERYPWQRDNRDTRVRGLNTEERGRMYFERFVEGRSRWGRCQPYCSRLQAEAMVYLAMTAGLRRIEIWNLKLDDLDADNEYIIVQGARKGRGQPAERAVPWLTTAMREGVTKWLEVRAELLRVDPPHEAHESPWLGLWPNQYRRTSDVKAFKTYDPMMRQLGYSWHRMRHTAATEMLRAGYPLTSVKEILGHANIAMTMRYVKLLRSDIVHTARINQANYEKRMGRAA